MDRLSPPHQTQQNGPTGTTTAPTPTETALALPGGGGDLSTPAHAKSSAGKMAAGPKLTRRERAKRLLTGLAIKHNPALNQRSGGTSTSSRSALNYSLSTPRGGGLGVGGVGDGSGAGAGDEGNSPATSPAGGGVRATVSPLVTATDSATVRPGMMLASVAAREGQGVSAEAVDTLGMGVKEAIETLIRFVDGWGAEVNGVEG